MATPIDLPVRTKEPQKPTENMAESQKTVHIDEDIGKDDASTPGTVDQPFKTLVFAYIQTDGSAQYLTRKAEAPAEGAEALKPEWRPAAKAVCCAYMRTIHVIN